MTEVLFNRLKYRVEKKYTLEISLLALDALEFSMKKLDETNIPFADLFRVKLFEVRCQLDRLRALTEQKNLQRIYDNKKGKTKPIKMKLKMSYSQWLTLALYIGDKNYLNDVFFLTQFKNIIVKEILEN